MTDDNTGGPMFEALGRVIYRRRRWVAALTLAFVVFAGVWGTGVFGHMTGGGFEDPDSESSRALEVAERELGRAGDDVIVLWSSDEMTVDDPAFADRKSTRLNSSHANISYAVFCLQKNKLGSTAIWVF